jgi:hypothetical protein
MEAAMLLRISEAVEWLRKERGIKYTRQALYRVIYRGELPFTQRAIPGAGIIRPGGRIMIDTEDLEQMFQKHSDG